MTYDVVVQNFNEKIRMDQERNIESFSTLRLSLPSSCLGQIRLPDEKDRNRSIKCLVSHIERVHCQLRRQTTLQILSLMQYLVCLDHRHCIVLMLMILSKVIRDDSPRSSSTDQKPLEKKNVSCSLSTNFPY